MLYSPRGPQSAATQYPCDQRQIEPRPMNAKDEAIEKAPQAERQQDGGEEAPQPDINAHESSRRPLISLLHPVVLALMAWLLVGERVQSR